MHIHLDTIVTLAILLLTAAVIILEIVVIMAIMALGHAICVSHYPFIKPYVNTPGRAFHKTHYLPNHILLSLVRLLRSLCQRQLCTACCGLSSDGRPSLLSSPLPQVTVPDLQKLVNHGGGVAVDIFSVSQKRPPASVMLLPLIHPGSRVNSEAMAFGAVYCMSYVLTEFEDVKQALHDATFEVQF